MKLSIFSVWVVFALTSSVPLAAPVPTDLAERSGAFHSVEGSESAPVRSSDGRVFDGFAPLSRTAGASLGRRWLKLAPEGAASAASTGARAADNSHAPAGSGSSNANHQPTPAPPASPPQGGAQHANAGGASSSGGAPAPANPDLNAATDEAKAAREAETLRIQQETLAETKANNKATLDETKKNNNITQQTAKTALNRQLQAAGMGLGGMAVAYGGVAAVNDFYEQPKLASEKAAASASSSASASASTQSAHARSLPVQSAAGLAKRAYLELYAK